VLPGGKSHAPGNAIQGESLRLACKTRRVWAIHCQQNEKNWLKKQVGNGFVDPNSMPAGMMLHTALKKTWS
jgi:hypothetical protein